jgi:hypothetical protein
MAAQEMVLKLSFNDDGTFQGLEEINQELQKVDNTSKDTAKGFTSAKAELRALQNQMQQMDKSSEEFKKASARAAQLKDDISDLSAEISANAGNAFEGLSNNIGLFGSRLLSLDLAGAGQALKNMGTNVSKIDFKTLKNEIGGLVSGFASLAKAIIANPILLLAGVIALVIANFEELVKFFPAIESGLSGINEQERESLALSKQKADASQKAYENLSLQENSLKLQGKSEREILNIKIKALETAIADRKAQLAITEKQAITQVQTAKRNREILEGVIRFLTAPLQLLLTAIDEIAKVIGVDSNLAEGFTDLAAGLLIDPQELETELNKTIQENKDAITKMESDYAGLQLSIKAIDKKASDDKKEKLQKEVDEYEKAQQEITDLLGKWDEERLAEEAKTDAERRKAYQDRRDAEIKAEDDKFKSLNAIQESAKEKEITAAIEASESLYALAGQDAAAEALIAENLAKQILDINKKYADEELKIEEEKDKKKQELRMQNIAKAFEMADLALGALMDLNNAAAKGDEASQRKAFNRNKMLQKAQATIAMASGIVQQLAVPKDQLTGMNFVKAAAVAAAGVANIVKINQTQFNGGGSGGSNGNLNEPTGGGANAPAIDFSGGQFNTNAPGTVETYVLAGNVANALEARQKIIDQANL